MAERWNRIAPEKGTAATPAPPGVIPARGPTNLWPSGRRKRNKTRAVLKHRRVCAFCAADMMCIKSLCPSDIY
jgi:hypothetical protein